MRVNDYNMGFDEEEKEFRANYTFSYTNDDDDISIEVSKSFEDGTTWQAVLQVFVNFLNNIYGYDISNKVRVQAYPFDFDLAETGWYGGTFEVETGVKAEEKETFPEAKENYTED